MWGTRAVSVSPGPKPYTFPGEQSWADLQGGGGERDPDMLGASVWYFVRRQVWPRETLAGRHGWLGAWLEVWLPWTSICKGLHWALLGQGGHQETQGQA